MNKVCTNIQQDFTPEQRAQARENISASQVKYINTIGGLTQEVGDLNLVNYESGLHLNDGDGNIGLVVPEPASGDHYKVLTDTPQGVRWENNNPPEDVFIKDYYDLQYGIGGNTTMLKQINFPLHDGHGPTKVEGHFVCYPDSNYDSLSIVPMASTSNESYNCYDIDQISNIPNLLALNQEGSGIGDYYNCVCFSFHKKPTIESKELLGVGIKGISSSSWSNYHIYNLEMRYFYEKPKETTV